MRKIRHWLLLVLVALSPFHAFFITWLKSAVPDGFVITAISAWREIIVVLIGLFVAIEFLIASTARERGRLQIPRNQLDLEGATRAPKIERKLPKFDALDWLIIAYAGLSAIFLPSQENVTQWMWGFRFDVLPFLFFLCIRQIQWEKVGILIKIAIVSASVVVIFGILHAFVLPQNFLMNFGYSNQQGPYKPELAISACQYLEHTATVCRATSTFASPMRYSSYLLLIIGLLFPFLIKKSRMRMISTIFFMLCVISIFLTYSRSGWIGLFIMAIATVYWGIPYARASRHWKKIIAGFITAVVLVLIMTTSIFRIYIIDNNPSSFAKSILIRTSSTSEHLQVLKDGIMAIWKNPLGIGLGKVGPASIRFGEKIVTENWYLQIALEMGIIGLILFIGILILLLKKLLEDRENWTRRGLFLSLLGISVAGLFIHSFEETTTVLLLMIFLGLYIPKKHAIVKI